MSAEGSTTVITGTLGGGKSLCAVDLGMERLALGGTVSANIPIYRDKVAKWMEEEEGKIMDQNRLHILEQDTIEDFQNFAIRGTSRLPAMLILDEAALDLNARDWKSRTDGEFNFVILARKLRIELIFIAQDASDIDKQIRKKMQREIHCRSLKNLFEFANLPVFVRVPYTIQINGKPWRGKPQVMWKAKSWGMFDSHALHGEKAKLYAALPEADDKPLQTVIKNPMPYVTAAAVAAGAAAITTIL